METLFSAYYLSLAVTSSSLLRSTVTVATGPTGGGLLDFVVCGVGCWCFLVLIFSFTLSEDTILAFFREIALLLDVVV